MSGPSFRQARYDYKSREGMTPEQIVAMFNDFAKEYDEEAFGVHSCMTSTVISEYLTEFYAPEKRSELNVLDVAAGTGALGDLMKKAGFVHVDGLDPAVKMLEVAKSKDVYQRYICEYMDGRRTSEINTNFYDLLTIADGLNIGLIPLKAFKEIVRIVKPGGLVVFTISKICLDLGYKEEFFSLLTRLEEEGVWEKVAHQHLEDGRLSYRGSGPGSLYAYQVKVSEMTSNIQ